MSELKKCPFCGGKAGIRTVGYTDLVECSQCETRGVRSMNTQDVITHWNTRPIEDALRAENERLRSLLRTVCNNGLELGYCEESFCLDCSNSEFSKKGR